MLIVDKHGIIGIEADGPPPCKVEAVLVFETFFEHSLLVVDALLLLS